MLNEQEERYLRNRYKEEQELREYEEQLAYEEYIKEQAKGQKEKNKNDIL